MLACELERLSQAVESLRGLAEVGGLFEQGARTLPIGRGERLAAEAHQVVRRGGAHRPE